MDINEISTVVQEHFLRKGTYLPTVFVELDGTDIEVLVIPQLDEKKGSTPERARILFDAGRTFGHQTERTQQSVTGLCIASISMSQDIHKKGILVVKMGEGNGLNCTTRFYEMRKDDSEIGVSLLENPFLSGEGMVSPLLPAFMLGVDTVRSHQSANEARRLLSAILTEYEHMIRGIGYYERYPGINAHY
jgi:hypothetical protein